MVGYRRTTVNSSEQVMNNASLCKKLSANQTHSRARIFYRCPERRSCHRISRWMQAFWAIKLLCSGTRWKILCVCVCVRACILACSSNSWIVEILSRFLLKWQVNIWVNPTRVCAPVVVITCVVTRLLAGRSEFRFLGGVSEFSLLQNANINSGAHQGSY